MAPHTCMVTGTVHFQVLCIHIGSNQLQTSYTSGVSAADEQNNIHDHRFHAEAD